MRADRHLVLDFALLFLYLCLNRRMGTFFTFTFATAHPASPDRHTDHAFHVVISQAAAWDEQVEAGKFPSSLKP